MQNRQQNYGNLLALLFPILLLLATIYKAYFAVNAIGGYHTNCNWCFIFDVLKHESIVYAFLLFLFYISTKFSTRFFAIFLRIFIVFMSLLYIADVVILNLFATHLVIGDIIKYIDSVPDVIVNIFDNVFSTNAKFFFLVLFFFILVATSNFLISPVHLHKRHQRLILAASLVIASFYPFISDRSYVHAWVYQNVFEYNFSVSGQDVQYSHEFEERIRSFENLDQQNCVPKASGNKNFVIVIFESLSSYHSHFFSNLNDITPNIDRIANESLSFHNFFSNDFTTEGALIAILTGLPPIAAPSKYSNGGGVAFDGFFNIKNSLPRVLKNYRYTSEFLTTGDLKFAYKGKWLENMGFDYIEGHSHPYYNNWKRYHFKAAPDEALFNRAIERIFRTKRNRPFLLIIETVSTHHPFINPDDDTYSEFGAFTYADRQLGLFYDRLKKNKFFDSGILIITSDHRSMTPLKKDEIEKYGIERAPAKVPLIVSFGGKVKDRENRLFQQTDLHSSIINHVSKEFCVSLWQGDLLSIPRTPAEFIIYKRGDNRDIISIFFNEKNLRIKLNGDKTALIQGSGIKEDVGEILLGKINWERLQRKYD